MKTISKRKWTFSVKITAFDLEGNVKDVTEFKNLIVADGLEMVVDAWQDSTLDIEIKDMALGKDNTPPDIADSTLGDEQYRMVFTSQAEVTPTSLRSIAIVPAADAVWQIEEIGWFAGVGANGVGPDVGILISRVLYSRLKTNLESLQIERTDTIAEA